ncbi:MULTISPECIES: permease [Priestia]|uniref:permease n=1 Tax=Priestia TaxID=2800373 RepID=UPI000A0863AE|nr:MULTISPECIES: permease [Priestia]MCM3541319.1 permease [Priestia endophytica]SMF75262.1 hypothetical protein SAMN06296056_11746 [Priestia filamentosa]
MKSRLGNLLMGILMLILSIYIIFDAGVNGKTKFVFSGLLFLSLSIMFFSLSYLNTDFRKQDERMKLIQQKSMFYSYFMLMLYFFLFALLLGMNVISISALAVIQILAALIIATVFISMLIMSKVY